MAINDYIKIDGKKYKVMADGWSPAIARFRTDGVGLTGKTIIVDLTNSSRKSQMWQYRLRVYVSTPPDSSYGTYADLLAAYDKTTVAFEEHDSSLTHTTTIRGAIQPSLRVPTSISGICNEVYHIPLTLVKVHQ